MPIILVRHGESESNVSDLTGGWTDTALTGLGFRQAEATARRLKEELADQTCRIVSSDLRRAMQTAEVIGNTLGVEPTPEPGLREINNGIATGKTREEVKHLFIKPTRPLIDWAPYPGAENWMQLHRRVTATMDKIYKNIEENLIIVGHGGSLHHVIFWWLKLPKNIIEDINFGLDNASITMLSLSALDQRLLERLNDTSHLRELY
jgi:broad specificity phosphatase PhoE